MTTTVMWFRRDLRLADNPALLDAVADAGGDGVVALFCLDDRLLRTAAGTPRLAYLYRCLQALDESIDGRLVVRRGNPAEVLPAVAAEVEAARVYAAADFGPYGSMRDEQVARALEARDIELCSVGSAYAVPPGTVLNAAGRPYKVFTPFSRSWRAVGWPTPRRAPTGTPWVELGSAVDLREEPACDSDLPEGGEQAARRTARRFWDTSVDEYDDVRNDPGADATSRLSPHLKFGTIHPRQLLSQLGSSEAHDRFRTELCWREFYADVLHARPDSARLSLQPAMRAMPVDVGPDTDERFHAWTRGQTGFPFVDAGMRQLLSEAWMHNRVRMVVASFLVKDLHLDWTRGAAHFMAHLVDGDLASNQHGWQWTAGTGTDPSPYFRIFNPVSQGERFDPDGVYVRRWVPELRGVSSRFIHRPWDDPAGPPTGYPAPMVDHGVEREEALRRYATTRTPDRLGP